MPNLYNDKYDLNHFRRVESYTQQIENIYKTLIREVTGLQSLRSVKLNPEKVFSINDFPAVKKQVESLLKKYAQTIQTTIVKGSEKEWKFAEQKQAALVDSVAKKAGFSKSLISEYKKHNQTALTAFQNRKSDGLNLSDRVWNYTNQFKNEIELGLDLGIGEGRSAAEMARDLKDYLKDSDKLFRRVRDKHGNLVLSQRAKDYHPGQGVYRSSYKNAVRLTRSETNIAYHEANHLKYQKFDFVIGIEVRLSNNPNHCPFCSEMAGKYPKDFKFWGWHPQCRCTTIPILKSWDEMEADNDLIAEGKEPLPSKNEVTQIHKPMEDWVENNRGKIDAAKVTPYFIQNNPQLVKSKRKKSYSMSNSDSPKEIKPLKIFNGSLQVFADKVFASGKTTNEIINIGKLHEVIIADLENKKINLSNTTISITDKKILKYKSHEKESKGAVIDKQRFSEIEKALANPAEIYEDIKTGTILYVYASEYEGKMLKLLIQPDYSIGGNSINLLKSIGVVSKQTFINSKQYLKLK